MKGRVSGGIPVPPPPPASPELAAPVGIASASQAAAWSPRDYGDNFPSGSAVASAAAPEYSTPGNYRAPPPKYPPDYGDVGVGSLGNDGMQGYPVGAGVQGPGSDPYEGYRAGSDPGGYAPSVPAVSPVSALGP